MSDYCWLEYRRFVKGLTSLYDESKGRYVSRFLNGSKFDIAHKNTVQTLFPILVPDIPQKHKDGIIEMLKSVILSAYRTNTIILITPFQLFRDLTQLTTQFLLLI
jgi:hypothetical protein